MISFFEKIKDSWNAWLKRLGEENAKEFGSGVPDCCKMNNQNASSSQKRD